MTPREYYTQNTPHDEEMVCYIDNEGNVIAGSGMLNGISLKPKMYKEVHSESKMSQNKTLKTKSRLLILSSVICVFLTILIIAGIVLAVYFTGKHSIQLLITLKYIIRINTL